MAAYRCASHGGVSVSSVPQMSSVGHAIDYALSVRSSPTVLTSTGRIGPAAW
jgi:hypothetical protein